MYQSFSLPPNTGDRQQKSGLDNYQAR